MSCILKRTAHPADGRHVIELHRLHGNGVIVVNADLVETVEACPDTVVTLATKRRFVVEDSVADVIAMCVAYRASIARATQGTSDEAAGARTGRTIHERSLIEQDKAA